MTEERAQTIQGTRTELTKGRYMGEEGVGYSFEPCSLAGDFAQRTAGYLQGCDSPVTLEVLEGEVYETVGGEHLLRHPEHGVLTANEAITLGVVRVLEA